MITALPPAILKARLKVVAAFTDGRDMQLAVASWLSIEPDAADAMGAKLIEAVATVIGDDRSMALVLFASSSFRLELAEAIDGRR